MTPHFLVLAGTRPEVIKLAPVVFELKNRKDIRVTLCSTGQHKQMLEQALFDFGLTPDEDLAVMHPNQTLASLSSRIFERVDPLLERLAPTWVIVQGDTTTVTIASLASFYRQIKVAHVEAGLRSFSKYAPFPEEINRRVAGVVADLHLTPTQEAKSNLLREGIPAEDIVVTGNTVIDALLWTKERIQDADLLPPIKSHISRGGRMVLITGHRRENFGQGFLDICWALRSLADKYHDILFVYPVHLNPNVQQPVNEILSGCKNILLVEPVSYKPFVTLMTASTLILTDSGGVQEEAPSLGKPVLVMRDVTERPEGVKAGTARLVGSNPKTIVSAVSELLDNETAYQKMAKAINPYGDGQAAAKIVNELLKRS